MFKPFTSIRAKLLIFGLCISLIPIAIISTIDYFNARSIVKKQTLDLLTAVAESREIHVLEFMNGRKGRATDFASDGFIRDSLEKINRGESLEHDTAIALNRHLLRHKKPLDPSIEGIEIVDLEGTVIISDREARIGQNIPEIERLTPGENLAYMRVIGKNYAETCVGSPHHSKLLNIDSVCAAAPITSRENGEPLGVIINHYNLELLNEITTNREGMGETGEVYLVNSEGLMITESRFIEDAPLKQVVDTEPVRRIAESGEEMTGIYPDYRGVPIVGASMYLPEYGLTLLAEIDKAEVFAPIRRLGMVALIVGLVTAAAVIGVGIVFAFSTSRLIRRLTDATEKFASGDLKTRVKIARRDEIGKLAGSFNIMAKGLEEEIAERKQAEFALAKQARLAKLGADVGAALTKALSLQDLLQLCTRALVKYLDVAFARIWMLDKEGNVLELQASSGMYTHIDGPHARVPVGKLKIGLIAQEGKPHLTNDVLNDPRIGDREWAKREGMVSFAGYPLIIEDRVVGVMAMFAKRPFAQDVFNVLKSVANEIAIGIEHTQTVDKLAEHATALALANVRLKELDQLKSMFVASMSHELRTPLNSIIGFTGVLLQGMVGELNSQQRDHLGRVNRSARHLLSLISDVIDISKIEAGKIEAFVEEFTLDGVINEAVESVEAQVKGKGLTLEVNVAPGVRLNTDRKRLLQCILNFLSNAAKFTEAGGISVAAREIEGEVEITVSDTGIGISEQDQAKLFEPFVRLDSHLRTRTLGTGLGLHLTRKLATELLGGSVAVQSQLGRGSTFTLRLPKQLKQQQSKS